MAEILRYGGLQEKRGYPKNMASQMRKINIAFVIDFLSDRRGMTGGTERQVIETINRLDRSRFRPILFCLQEFHKISLWDNLSLEKHLLNVYSLKSWQGVLAFWSFVRFLQKESVDIVQTYFHDSTLFGVAAGRFAGVPQIISCRRDLGFWYGERVPRSMRLANRFSDRFIVNSESVREVMAAREGVLHGKVEVIPNGIDSIGLANVNAVPLMREYPQIKNNDKIVGIVANFNRRVKRLDLFLESAARVVAKFQQVKFLIIGGGKLENDLKKMAHALGIGNFVIFAGPKEPSVGYIKGFDIGVLCSDSEGFSNTLLEYMAVGVPAVATSVGGNREIVKDGLTGRLVPPGDPECLAEAIIQLLREDCRRGNMGEVGRQLVRNRYDWKVIIKQMEDFYLLLAGHETGDFVPSR